MTLNVLSFLSLLFASLPAVMTIINSRRYRTLRPPGAASLPPISILIPARDEAAGIQRALRSALASTELDFEVLVLDDHSTDETAKIVAELAAANPKLNLYESRPLPEGWNGKQHACHQLAELAKCDLLLFIDADVRLAPDAAARIAAEMQRRPELGLLSLFPRQETGTFWEQLLIPLMHYILLGFLPFARMRETKDPAFAAGCGQLFCARRAAYHDSGGHAAIRHSRHDGITLPRSFRSAGWYTDCLDGTDVARCRMYRSAGEVVRGLLKNATEGIGNPRTIIPFTVLLLGGGVLPFVLLPLAVERENTFAATIALTACGLAYLPRLINTVRLQQSWRGLLFQPVAITFFVALQWVALVSAAVGLRPRWRGRSS